MGLDPIRFRAYWNGVFDAGLILAIFLGLHWILEAVK